MDTADLVSQLDLITMSAPLTRGRLWLLDDQRLGRKEPNMIIIGVDYHPSFQQIAFLGQETGECGERRLNHSDGEAEKFYRDLKLRGVSVRVGIEATGHSRWFERLLAELGIEVWIGDAAKIQTKRVRKQKTRPSRYRPVWLFANAAQPGCAALESTSQKDFRIRDSCE
jgi:hypothetical protein